MAKINCFLEINNKPKLPFWVDELCNCRRIRRCLNETLGYSICPLFTEIYLNGKKIDDETKPLSQLGIKFNDCIKVITIEALADQTTQAQFILENTTNPNFVSSKCRTCGKLFDTSKPENYQIYIGCKHVVFCSAECNNDSGPCPVCNPRK